MPLKNLFPARMPLRLRIVVTAVSICIIAGGVLLAVKYFNRAAVPGLTQNSPAEESPGITVKSGPSISQPQPAKKPDNKKNTAVKSASPDESENAVSGNSGTANVPVAGNAGYGYFADLQYMNSTDVASTLSEWKNAGAKWARFQIKWSSIQYGGPGAYDWGQYDMVINAIDSSGLVPLPVVGDTPAWARPASCTAGETCAPDPQHYSAFSTFVAAAANRYSGKINHWEVWNEANNPYFWAPAPNISDYTALLQSVYSHVHASQPGATIITSGLAPASDSQGGGWISPVTFLTGIYSSGGQGSFDAVGWHPYTWPADPATQNAGLAWYQMVNNARSLMNGHGDSSKKIWATEFGVPTCTQNNRCVAESVQAAHMQSAVSMWKSYAWAGPLIAYSFKDTCGTQTDPECYFGVSSSTGIAKPALQILKNAY